MPLTTPISGQHGKVSYGATPTVLGITNWKFTPKSNPLDLSNTADGRRRIAGLGDGEGSFDLHVDTGATMETDLAVGTIIVLNLFTDGTKKYGIPLAIIESIDYSSEVEGSYDASVKWQLASGTLPITPA